MLPRWKKDFLTYPGKELLVKVVLSGMPTYFLTVYRMPKWGISRIDMFRRGFLWKRRDVVKDQGGRSEGGGGGGVNMSRIKFFSRIGLCTKIKTPGNLYARI
jgi:hypothetical protein